MPLRTSKTSAFSLVELSIVLVVLGLLIGGVLSGRALIRAAELRSVAVELEKFQTAANTFKLQYDALPGDMPNATQIWGSARSNCQSWTGPISTDKRTCNGNGSGTLGSVTFSATGSISYDEDLTFWHHLKNAGLIEGDYNAWKGSAVAGDPAFRVAGESFPKSKLAPASWKILRFGHSGSSHYFEGMWEAPQLLEFGEWYSEGTGTSNNAQVLTPEEAWNIDKKIDDGYPATGSLFGGNAVSCLPCVVTSGTASCAAANDPNAEYYLRDNRKSCILRFIPNF